MLSLVFLGLLAVTTAGPVGQAAPFDAVAHAATVLGNVRHGFFADPIDCTKFYTAVKTSSGVFDVHRLSCGPNTYWKDDSLACVSGHCADTPVPCNANGFFADDANCAAYYQCSHNVAWRMCCPAGTAWDSKTDQCDFSTTCTDQPDCPAEKPLTTSTAPTTFCDDGNWKYEKKDGDDNAFIQTKLDDDTIMYDGKCAAGTGPFSLKECGCLQEKVFEEKKCVDFTFAGTTFSNQLAYVEDVKATLKDGAACLTGDGYLAVPLYNNNPLGEGVQLSFDYKSDGKDAILLTNGGCIMKTASVQVEIKDGFIQVDLVTTVDQYRITLRAKSDIVKVTYDGKKLALAVGDNESTTTAKGEIVTVACDVKMGLKLNGCIKSVKFCEA